MKEKNAYILGTESAELHRLGLQHQVWSAEAREGWKRAGFGAGQTLLDLGCGPGFCTSELAYMVGIDGKVIGVDKSEAYIAFLHKIVELYGLPIEALATDFDNMDLELSSLDGAYCRWALAWIPNPDVVIGKVAEALKPGAKFVVHEYYDWSSFQTEPTFAGLQVGIRKALQSFKEQDGEIDIGRKLPELFEDCGLKIVSKRPMTKLANPADLTWQWPYTFLNIYLPKLVELGYLSSTQLEEALKDLELLSKNKNATILCPHMIEVIGEKKDRI